MGLSITLLFFFWVGIMNKKVSDMKKTALLAAILAGLAISGTAQADVTGTRYDFDGAGEYEYGRSKYEVYYSSYLSMCGSYQTINESGIFGEKEVYDALYPVIGQMDAELEQVSAVKGGTRRSMVDIFKETKQVMDVGYTMEEAHTRQLEEMKKNTARIGGESYYNRAKTQIDASHKDLDRAVQMKRRDAERKVLGLLRSDAGGSVIRSGEQVPEPSSYDRWQDCKGFWSYAETNKDQLRGQGYHNGSGSYR